jgi:hypothetical protein
MNYIEEINKLNNNNRFIDFLNKMIYKVYVLKHRSYLDNTEIKFTIIIN